MILFKKKISILRFLELKWRYSVIFYTAGDEGRPTKYELSRVDISLKLFLMLDFGWRTGKETAEIIFMHSRKPGFAHEHNMQQQRKSLYAVVKL